MCNFTITKPGFEVKKSILLTVLLFNLGYPAFAQTYYGTTGVIPDDGSTKIFNANVSGLEPSSLDSLFGLESVCITILHPWVSDIDVALMAPDSTYVFLSSAMGGGDDNYYNTCFDNNSPESIIRAYAPFTGTFKPMGDLGRVNNGQSGNGTWRLLIEDIYPWADQGTVLFWSLNFSDQPSLPRPLLSSELPIVVINTEGQFIPDDPKLMAQMGIIDHGPGGINHVSDPFNAYDGFIGIERRGSSSQSFPKKSFGFETWDSTGSSIDVSLFGMPEESDWILNANYNDKTLQRNVLTYYLSGQMGHYASRSKYCELILNGQYWGVYIFQEKIKRDGDRVDISKLTVDDTSGVDITGGYILKIDKTTGDWGGGWVSPYPPVVSQDGQTIFFLHEYPKEEELLSQQLDYIKAYIDTFETALYYPGPGGIADYRDYIDMTSFIDFFIINEISRNVDGYRLSTFFYKDRAGKLVMGPVWDFDIAWHNADYCEAFNPEGWAYEFGNYCPGDWWQVPFWWDRLTTDTSFTDPLKCRWEELRIGALSEESLFAVVDSLSATLDGGQQRNFYQWPILGIYVWPNPWPIPLTFDGEVENLKEWISQRLSWLDDNIPGTCDTFTINENNPDGPELRVFPNPFNEQLNLSLSNSGSTIDEVIIYNSVGDPVKMIHAPFSKGVMTISTTDLPPGLYFVKVVNSLNTRVSKVAKR